MRSVLRRWSHELAFKSLRLSKVLHALSVPAKALKRSPVWRYCRAAISIGASYAFPALAALGCMASLFPPLDMLNQLAPLLLLACLATLAWRLFRRAWQDRRMELAACSLGVVLAGGALLQEALASPPLDPCGPGAVTVLSQNLWSHNLDPTRTAKQLAATGADVILLQEVRADGAAVVEKLHADYPFVADCAAITHWCSLAIVSRLPFDKPWTYHNGTWRGDPKDVASYVRVDLRTPSGAPMTVFTSHLLHLDNPLQPLQISELVEAFKSIDRRTFVFGGDMNLTPWTRSLQGIDATIDAVRVTRNISTWPARAPFPGFAAPAPFAMWPIDHIFAGAGWRACRVRRGPRVGSDHYAAIATLVPVQAGPLPGLGN